MIGPPTNSAAVKCQPSKNAMMIPSSITRLVEAISKTMTAVKSAPLRKRARARATAAYEHDELAMPRAVATPRVFDESLPRRRSMVPLRTRAWTIADRTNPKMSDQRICQVIPPAAANVCPMAWMNLIAEASPRRVARWMGVPPR